MDLAEKLKRFEERIAKRPEPEFDAFTDGEEAKKPLHQHEWVKGKHKETGEIVVICSICKGVRQIQ